MQHRFSLRKPRNATAVQNYCITTTFGHGFLPSIDSCYVLGTPPRVLLSTAINVTFVLKLKKGDGLLHWTQNESFLSNSVAVEDFFEIHTEKSKSS